MSNLGMYQTITTLSKKVGGPVKLLALVAVGGYVVIRPVEAVAKKTFRVIKKRLSKKQDNHAEIFVVHTKGESNEGLIFNIGDQFRVLEIDQDTVLIEKIGDGGNPYFVPVDLLYSISNFNHQE